jgi:hypothetical protein
MRAIDRERASAKRRQAGQFGLIGGGECIGELLLGEGAA